MKRRTAAHPLVFALAIAVLGTGLLGGCASAPPRFDDGPAVWTVDDTADIPRPAENEFWRLSHIVDNYSLRQIRLRMDPMPAPPAEDVNRLGEVPSSSWYENRIEGLSAAQVRDGAGGDDPGPEAHRPWTITGMKVGGRNPGFVFADARGASYICKFDKQGSPVIATAAGAVAARLLWAVGYHTPDDRVVFFRRDELLVGAEATVKADDGFKRPLVDADIDAMLASVPSLTADGRHRALVSRYLSGRPVGGFDYRGTRADDPNDLIPHQNRRSLRALRVFGAWLNHVDLKVDNTLDAHVEEDGRGFLRHYLVDFDGCLGGYWAARHEPRIGFAYDFDLKESVFGIPALGLVRRPYEDLLVPEHPLVGVFESDAFDPDIWKPNYSNDYVQSCRPADAFWAGTVLAQVTDEMIAAAVEVGRYEDPAAEEVLARVLRERRDETLDWALTRVSPVLVEDDPSRTTGGLAVSAEDALVRSGRPSDWRYRVEIFTASGRSLGELLEIRDTPSVTVPGSLVGEREYLIVRWTAENGAGQRLPPAEAHFRRGESGWKLAGILRDGE